MADLPTHARVVIIGGGAVGASCLYHLAKAGWTDCVLLEKNELTAGSTWHAAGNIPNFSGSWAVMNMQRYSTEQYRKLADEVDYPMNYHVTGSLRLGHTKERMQEFEKVAGMGRHQGLEMTMMTPDEMRDAYPFMETHDLMGGLYDPYDGDMDPAQLTQAYAKGARDLGAKIIRFCPATGARRQNDEWVISVAPDKGEPAEIRCEYVVNAAGYYAKEVGKWFGRDVPMMVMSHQYVLFDDVPEIAAWSKENGRKLPLLRDVDVSYYLRQEKNGFNLGPYENPCRAHWDTPSDPMPADFSFQLWQEDLDRIEYQLVDASERVPLMASAGLNKVINGPIPYAPDGHPLIGPMPGVPNAFEACVFTFGICQAGGAGHVLTQWITEGQTEQDMWAVDPRRYTDYTDHDYCVAKGKEIYGHEYAIHFPHHRWPAGRDKKLSPVDADIRAAGGQMEAYNGWERAAYFANDGDDTSEEAQHSYLRNGPWFERVKEECEAVRDGVGVLDLPGFSRFNLSGDGAATWLDGRITGRLPKAGRMGLGYFADDQGRIVTEMSIMRQGEDAFTLITAATAQWHDRDWLLASLPEGLSLTDHTTEFSTLIVTGPKSRALFEALDTDADLTLPWLSHQKATIGGTKCALARVSFAGELGWEIHAANADIPVLYRAVVSAGAKPFGMYALDSLRLEKGYRAWKGDLSTDYTVLEGGLDRFVHWSKPEFVGKAALENERQQGSVKKFATLVVDAGEFDAPYMSSVYKGDEIVGETTSGGWGHRVNKSLALSVLRTDCTAPGTALEIEMFGTRYPAVVNESQTVWDPENERLRA